MPTCQCRELPLHCCQDVSICELRVGILKRSRSHMRSLCWSVHARLGSVTTVHYEDRQAWPGVQHLPHGALAPQQSPKFRRHGTQKQRFTIFDTRAPAYTTRVSIIGPYRNRIYNIGECRLSSGLPSASQQCYRVRDVHTSPSFCKFFPRRMVYLMFGQ